MVLSIKTNISALGSLNNLDKNQAATQRTFARLSSGSRITTARDDASGLAISNNLRLDLASADSALSNIKQATAVLQIADSGLETIQAKINRMTELSAMAASSTLSNAERAHLDAEFQTLKDAITADTQRIRFNGENLLGERPEFALGPIGSDIETDDGVGGFQFDNDGLFQANDIFEFTYDSATNVFQIENTNTSYRESIQGPVGGIVDGKTFDLKFEKMGVDIKLSSEFDFATDIDPAVDDATFIIRANDPLAPGFTPNDLSNLVANISAEDGVVNVVGTGIQSVSDLEVTGGNNQATQGAAGARPTLDFGGIFGRDAIDFDGNDVLTIGNSGAINTSVHQQRTIAFNFETAGDVGSRQVIYEEGGGVNGINAYIQGGRLYMGVYRSNGANSSFTSVAIAANTQYTASFDFDSTTNTVRAYLNGVEFANQGGIGAALPSHSGGIALGGLNGSTRIHTGATISGGGNRFQGKVGDFLLYNDTFAAGDHANLNLHLRGAAAPATAGFSNEQMAFQIDHAQGTQLIYEKPQTDFMVVQLSSLNVLNIGNANIAADELRAATEFLSTERSKIGGLLSQLEFASNQVSTFKENTVNANSVLRDADMAKETTQVAADVLKSRVNVLTMRQALDAGNQLLRLLNGG
ncbi:MAG: hypothetical protein CMF62_08100 [Magnetococcales bacterium]|nr:hypothetical protein [Magnetococcales bacterium]